MHHITPVSLYQPKVHSAVNSITKPSLSSSCSLSISRHLAQWSMLQRLWLCKYYVEHFSLGAAIAQSLQWLRQELIDWGVTVSVPVGSRFQEIQTGSVAHRASWGLIRMGLIGLGVKLAAFLHPVISLRMQGAIPIRPYMHSWSAQEQVNPYFNIFIFRDIFHIG